MAYEYQETEKPIPGGTQETANIVAAALNIFRQNGGAAAKLNLCEDSRVSDTAHPGLDGSA